MKPKILVLPTYWPSPQSPIVGSQIMEQTALMDDDFDMKALYCLPGMGWKRFLIYLAIGFFLGDKKYSKIEYVKNCRVNTVGVYYFSSRFFPRVFNCYLKKRAYKFCFDKMVKNGWIPDLMHSRGFEYGGEMALYLFGKFNIPYVHTENTAFLFDENFSLYRVKLYKDVLSNASHLLFVSNFLLRNTLMHGFLKSKNYTIIGNPVDDQLFTIHNERENDGVFRILITGYNSYIKDYNTFFRAIAHLKAKGVEKFKVFVAMTYGNEQSKNELINLANVYGVDKYCEFKISVSRNDMPKLINMCDVCVSTSLIETFGIATLEAMFCGVPVIATKNGGIEDFFSAEVGILCSIGAFEEIGDALLKIINKTIIFNQEQIRCNVVDKFGLFIFKQKLKVIYENNI